VEIVRVGVDGRVPLLFRERSNLPTLIVRSENPGVRGFLFRRGSPTNPVCFRQRRSSLISLLEGNGFELSVPRAMQDRPTTIIAGFGCMPPSLHYLQLP